MNSRRWLACLLVLVAPAAAVRADDWTKLRARGGEVYFLDTDLRAEFAKQSPKALAESKRKLPAVTAPAFDWSALIARKFNYTQATNPQCWAFATVTALEWNWAIRNAETIPLLAVQPIIDRCKKEGEASHSTALQVLLEQGTCPLVAYPYTGKASKIRTTVTFSYRAIAWGEVVPGHVLPDPARVKQALAEHGPVVACVYATQQFHDYKGGVYKEHFAPPADKPPVNHSVVIVGWDDRKGKAGCWKIQNSWGLQWGEAGYMWIEYGCNNIGIDACWIRPQSDQYQLPEDAHKLIPGDVAPFHRWKAAKAVAPPAAPELPTLTAAEALKKPGERVVVGFTVKGYGTVEPGGHVELFSERRRADENCVIVRLLGSVLDKFPAQNADALYKHYRGKQLRVRGSMQAITTASGTHLVLEVADPGQIEVVH
jgi:hypothetical protein